MIEVIKADYKEIEINPREVLRYMGCRPDNADGKIRELAEKSISEIYPRLSCRACFERYPVAFENDGILNLGFAETTSAGLKKNLDGCKEIILFAATIGMDTDRIIQKNSLLSPSAAVAAQAVGAAAIEGWCDILCRRFEKTESMSGNHIRPRFSPGYGDFPLDIQRRIFSVLDCSRKIGVTLTDSLLMMPSKSVSAIVGIGGGKKKCTETGCAACNNINCEFRERK